MISIIVSASASMVTPSTDTSVSNGVYVPGGITNGDVKPAISTTPLADFLMQLEEYTPTVSHISPVFLLNTAFKDMKTALLMFLVDFDIVLQCYQFCRPH